jgi:hypothetical protein
MSLDREEIHKMANDNQGSRTFLAIVLGGIVLALVIAAYFMYGHKGDTGVKVEQPVTEQPAETPAAPPAAETPAAPPAAEMPPAETPAAPEPPAPETPAPEEAPAPQNP